MNTVVPYVLGKLRHQTAAAVLKHAPDARFVPLPAGDDEAYWRLWGDVWASGEDTVVIEQDIVPTAEVFRGFRECPEPWCAHAYEYASFGLYAGTGCVRFRGELTRRLPGLIDQAGEMSNDQHPPRHWCTLDQWIQTLLTQHGERMCRHQLLVQHLDTAVSHGCNH